MTTVSFFTVGEKITGFSAKGHAGCGEAGNDIVCAAITSAIRLAECTLNDVMGIGAKVDLKEDGHLKLKLPAECKLEAAQSVLMGLMLHLSDLRDDYPDYLEVLEVEQHA